MIGEFWRKLAQNRLLDVGMGLIAVLAIGRLAVVLPGRVFEWDFAHYYVSSRALLEGQNPYEISLGDQSHQQGFVVSDIIPRTTNPPPLLWLVAAFAGASPRVAFWGWTAWQAVSLAAVLGLTWVLLRGRLSARGWWFFCAGVISSQAVYYHFRFGQAQLLLVALVLGGFLCARRGQGMTACVLITIAGVTKLFPLALLPWFIWRGGGRQGLWRRLGAAVATGLVMVIATGWGLWCSFFHYAPAIVNDFAPWRTFNFTVPSLIFNLCAVAAGQTATVPELHVWWTIATLAGLGTIAMSYCLVWRRRGDPTTEFCFLCVAMLAGNPVTWGHYFVFLIFPVAVTITRFREGMTEWRLLGLSLLILALNVLDLAGNTWLERRFFLAFIANYIPLVGLLGLWWLFARWLGADGEQGAGAVSPKSSGQV